MHLGDLPLHENHFYIRQGAKWQIVADSRKQIRQDVVCQGENPLINPNFSSLNYLRNQEELKLRRSKDPQWKQPVCLYVDT